MSSEDLPLKLLKLFVPPKLRAHLRDWYWRQLNLGIKKLPSGLSLLISTFHDWIIYNEIFEKSEYDLAIKKALEQVQEQEKFIAIDLGANIGYFILKLADEIKQSNPELCFQIFAIEGSSNNFSKLKEQISVNSSIEKSIVLKQGLVGELSGGAHFVDDGIHYGCHISATACSSSSKVPYLNLNKLVDPLEQIDLLKCDIEGSETEFIRNYPEILKRTKHLCIEFHGDVVYQECLELLKHLGFKSHQVISKVEHETMVMTTIYTRNENSVTVGQ